MYTERYDAGWLTGSLVGICDFVRQIHLWFISLAFYQSLWTTIKTKYHKILIYTHLYRFDSITTNRRMFSIKSKCLFAHIVIYTLIRSQTRNTQSICIFRSPLFQFVLYCNQSSVISILFSVRCSVLIIFLTSSTKRFLIRVDTKQMDCIDIMTKSTPKHVRRLIGDNGK